MKKLLILLTVILVLGTSCERSKYKKLKKHKIRKPYPENGCWFGNQEFEILINNKIKFS